MSIKNIVDNALDLGVFLYLEGEALKFKVKKGQFPQALKADLKKHKPQIIQYLKEVEQQQSNDHQAVGAITKRPDGLTPVLSFAQQRLWLLDQIDGGSAHYNLPGAIKLVGTLDYQALNRTLSAIIERHESLRTCFGAHEDGQPYQIIQPPAALIVQLQDLSSVEPVLQQQKVAEIEQQETGRVFDLSADLMLRAQLLKVADDQHILLVTLHHIASDGWSMAILTQEFSALYRAFSQGQSNPLPPLVIQYADYAHWQRHWLQGEVLDKQLAYWQQQLADLPVIHSLPLDKPRPRTLGYHGNTHVSLLDAQTAQTLNALCKTQGATLFMGLHTVFSVLLSRYSNETDIVVGSPIANREQPEITDLIGFFVNTLVLRIDLSENPSFSDLLGRSKTLLLDAYAHQQVPFEQLVETLQPQRSESHSPLFQVMLVLQNNQQSVFELPGLALSAQDLQSDMAKFDLTLNVGQDGQALNLGWQYNTDLFESVTIERMASHFNGLLVALLKDPQQCVFDARMQSDTERHQMLVQWNETAAAYPQDQCIHHLFEAQVAKTPDAIVLVFDQQKVTYAQLNRQANQLAHYLIDEKNVQPDTLVGICVERSLDMVVGIVSILKAGGAYVPLDPDYPAGRLAYLLEDANLSTVLTHQDVMARTPITSEQAVFFDDPAIKTQPSINPCTQPLTSAHLAYVIYTSGSTGQPKGVMVEQHSVVSLVRDESYVSLGPNNVVAQVSNMSFDAMTFELWGALLNGATLVYLAKDTLLTPDSLAAAIDQQRVDTLFITTALFNLIARDHPAALGQLTNVLFGGEDCSRGAVQQILKKGAPQNLLHVYGPTENTTFSLWKKLTTDYVEDAAKVALGKGMSNTVCYVLDYRQNPVPVGVAGELYLGGAGLARGYLNRPDLTQQMFITNPFYDRQDPNSCQRLYKTGDLVRYLTGGDLEFLGRIDHQVKIRGFRIEPAEVEHVLAAHDNVKDVAMLVKTSILGDKYLVAYVVSETAQDVVPLLRAYLAQRLPDYMMPSTFVLLEQMPLTANGKIDRKALPEPDVEDQQQTYVAPQSEVEIVLCEIFQEVLAIKQVGTTDNFFTLGGHSLLATRVMTQVNQRLGVTLALKTIFSNPVLAQLAIAVSSLDAKTDYPPLVGVKREDNLPFSYTQQRLWLLDQIEGSSAQYNIPVTLKLTGSLDIRALNQALTTIIDRHESLRTCFVKGQDSQPCQVIQTPTKLAVGVEDLTALDSVTLQQQITELSTIEAVKPFDLSADLMLRAQLFKVAFDEHVLLVTLHHIAADGWSMTLLIDEVGALYRAYRQGQDNPLAPLPIQYADYAQWQRNWLQGEVLDKQLAYWQQQLADLPVVHSLPVDKPRPSRQSYAGKTHTSQLAFELTQALNDWCQAQGATLFMGLHAAFAVLLSRHSNETDIVVGSPIANREQAEVADLIGFFANTLVLRSDLSDNPSFIDLLRQSKHHLLDAYAHQQVPFEQIVETLQPARNLGHSPLFQVMLILQNNQQTALQLPDLTLSTQAQQSLVAKFDLTLNIRQDENGLTLSWEYNCDLFDTTTIEGLAAHFNRLLDALLRAPQQSVFSAQMQSEAQCQQLLTQWNNTAVAYPQNDCIHQLFESQVEKTPDLVAVVFEQQQLTYAELDIRANQLAHYLIAHRDINPDTLVGICIDRSLDMVVGILGILKAGGAYVPLDPNYPQARLAYMLKDANLDTVLTRREMLARTPISQAQAVFFDDPAIQTQLDSAIQLPTLTSNHLAYVIYTSGSTGQPKGVMIEHQSVVNFLTGMQSKPGITQQDTLLAITSTSFDIHGLELFLPLVFGAKLVVAAASDTVNPAQLIDLIATQSITMMQATPATWKMLVDDQWQPPSPIKILCGGEALSEHLAEALRADNNIELWNMYGPTETTIWSCCQQIGPESQRISIGKPIANTTVFLLDDTLALAPVGVPAQLYIGGAGLARGYLNRPDLTAEHFINNPFYDRSDGNNDDRLYKTGDLVRYLPDGTLAFLGRIDHQVKIRGFRIELAEIEQVLATHEQVKDVVLMARTSATGDNHLVAYFVPEDTAHEGEIAELREYLALRLPEHMVPSVFVSLGQLPLTANGKIDRKALPEADVSRRQTQYVAPQGDVETALCDIWQEVLGIEQVGRTDDFFALGGHSLLAIKLVGKVNKQFSATFGVADVFSQPVLMAQAAAIEQNQLGNEEPQIVVNSLDQLDNDDIEEFDL